MADPEKFAAEMGLSYKKPKNRDGPGKGDRRREQHCNQEEFARRWDQIFDRQYDELDNESP